MQILIFEDNVIKYSNICNALRNGNLGPYSIDHVKYLEDGVAKIIQESSNEKSYDLIITDMWYPTKAGMEESNSGEELIRIVSEKGWNIPIIVCSSINYRINGILGAIHYSEKSDWENELMRLIKNIKK